MFPVVFLLVCFLSCSVSAEPQRQLIAAHRGDDVTLPCHAPNNVIISAVEWTRSDLERHVYIKIDKHLNTADQDPSYVNRTQLKNGELSLILKNVNKNDEGTYECRYLEERGGAVQSKLISIIYLDVKDQQETAKHGDDVTLSCEAPNNVPIAAVKWTRSGLERHVYLMSNRYLNTAEQDPSYVNRVQLKDDEMKNGDLSLILKNVNNNDEGTYVCGYVEERTTKSKLICIIYLKVEGGDSEDGHYKHGQLGLGLTVSLIVVLVTVSLVCLVGLVIYKKLKGRSEKKPNLPFEVRQQLQERKQSINITHNNSYRILKLRRS